VNEGRAPFHEPGLDQLVAEGVRNNRLSATSSAAEILDRVEIAFVCVGTPSEKNGNVSLEQVKRVVADLDEAMLGRTHPLIVAVRSTVFPGTCESEILPVLSHHSCCEVVSNPEFLREGAAIRDFMEPSLLVIGGCNPAAAERVADVYKSLPVAPCIVSLRTAEMIKYACNAFHAVKVTFANEIGALSEAVGVDAAEVIATACEDRKLNISPAYLRPGFPFGGSCLPKDLRTVTYRARHLDLKLPLLESTLPSNLEHLERAIDKVFEIPSRRIGVIGLAFKENTDDLRESPVVGLLERLIGKGREVRVFDPHIRLDSIYGSNRTFVLEQIPHIGKLLDATIENTLAWAEHVVIAQKLEEPLVRAINESGRPVLNLVGGQFRRSGHKSGSPAARPLERKQSAT
jgi:GDP-mannose 6-dehydrogenase